MRQKFQLKYLPVFLQHMEFIEKKYWRLVRKTIELQLQYEPAIETRNRKPLNPAEEFGSWELRFGPQNRFRVFYDIREDKRIVQINAIGIKEGNDLMIAGQEIL